MKCTLITGSQTSDNTALARWIAKPYLPTKVCHFKALKPEEDPERFARAVEALLSPDCQLIMVLGINDLSLLKNWLLLSRQSSLYSRMPGRDHKDIRPEIVLTFQTDKPAKEILTRSDTKGAKVIDLIKNIVTKN